APGPWPRRLWPQAARPSLAGAIPPRRSRRSATPTGSRTCPPVAGRRSSSSRGSRFPELRPWMTGSQNGRRAFLAGNWKMHKTNAEAAEFLEAFLPAAAARTDIEIFLCAPFTALRTLIELTGSSEVRVAAQNMHEAPAGAFTGEVSAPMLTELRV